MVRTSSRPSPGRRRRLDPGRAAVALVAVAVALLVAAGVVRLPGDGPATIDGALLEQGMTLWSSGDRRAVPPTAEIDCPPVPAREGAVAVCRVAHGLAIRTLAAEADDGGAAHLPPARPWRVRVRIAAIERAGSAGRGHGRIVRVRTDLRRLAPR